MSADRKIIGATFFICVGCSVVVSFLLTHLLVDSHIEQRKKGEDIGYKIGWEAGSNACYNNK